MATKVKELKDDSTVDIKINKNYYLMLKATLHFLFNLIEDEKVRAVKVKKIMEGKYEEMDAFERSFYTITLALAEIEKEAQEQKLFEEKEILEPGDDGYVEPTQG